jgi:phosphatidylinositol 3-kinase
MYAGALTRSWRAPACLPLQDPEKAMLRIQEKLRLDFDDEQAVEAMQGLINESATALMPQIVETTHRWAQYWR